MNQVDIPQILYADDEENMRDLAAYFLKSNYDVALAPDGRHCLALLQARKFDLILLDVEMPQLDGYDTCRHIKADARLRDIPVIFISSHDRIEDRIKGYDSGGEDYLTKPYNPDELKAKIGANLRSAKARSELQEMADFAGRTAMTAMTNLSEMGILIEAIKRFNTCKTMTELADATCQGLALYGLRGAVQVRYGTDSVTRAEGRDGSPLVASIFKHMTTMDRITSYKSRICITYAHVSLLIDNMPEEDPERCGRLRDHLAVLVDTADMRMQAMNSENALQHVGERLVGVLADIDRKMRSGKLETNLAVNQLNENLLRVLMSLGLTDAQEQHITHLMQRGIDTILSHEASNVDIQDQLTSIVRELKQARAA